MIGWPRTLLLAGLAATAVLADTWSPASQPPEAHRPQAFHQPRPPPDPSPPRATGRAAIIKLVVLVPSHGPGKSPADARDTWRHVGPFLASVPPDTQVLVAGWRDGQPALLSNPGTPSSIDEASWVGWSTARAAPDAGALRTLVVDIVHSHNHLATLVIADEPFVPREHPSWLRDPSRSTEAPLVLSDPRNLSSSRSDP